MCAASRADLLFALALEAGGGYETLNVGRLVAGLLALLLDLAADHVFPDVVLLAQVEKLADVVGALGPKTARLGGV